MNWFNWLLNRIKEAKNEQVCESIQAPLFGSADENDDADLTAIFAATALFCHLTGGYQLSAETNSNVCWIGLNKMTRNAVKLS